MMTASLGSIMPNECLTNRTKSQPEPVGYNRFDDPDDGHFQTRGPPGANRDKGFDRADRKMGQDADDERGDHGREAAHEKERHDGDESADRGRETGGQSGSPLVGEMMLR